MNSNRVVQGWKLAMVAGLVAGSVGCASTPEPGDGHRAREELMAKAEEAGQQLAATRKAIQGTLTRYNTVLSNKGQDPVKEYEEFVAALRSSEKRLSSLNKKFTALEASSGELFAAWEADFELFESESIKKLSQERLHLVRRQYGQIRTSMQPAAARSEQFLKNLRDQMLFLKYDLSPSARQFLRKDAIALNRSGTAMFGSIDGALNATGNFVSAMQTSGKIPDTASTAETKPTDRADSAPAEASTTSETKAEAAPKPKKTGDVPPRR